MTKTDLAGLLVVSVEQAVAAPLVSSRLAEAGARVIRVERPGGDFASNCDRLVHGESGRPPELGAVPALGAHTAEIVAEFGAAVPVE